MPSGILAAILASQSAGLTWVLYFMHVICDVVATLQTGAATTYLRAACAWQYAALAALKVFTVKRECVCRLADATIWGRVGLSRAPERRGGAQAG